MKLLIAAARVDGDIHEREREILVQVMVKLGISVERFGELYKEALALVDSLRRRRTGG